MTTNRGVAGASRFWFWWRWHWLWGSGTCDISRADSNGSTPGKKNLQRPRQIPHRAMRILETRREQLPAMQRRLARAAQRLRVVLQLPSRPIPLRVRRPMPRQTAPRRAIRRRAIPHRMVRHRIPATRVLRRMLLRRPIRRLRQDNPLSRRRLRRALMRSLRIKLQIRILETNHSRLQLLHPPRNDLRGPLHLSQLQPSLRQQEPSIRWAKQSATSMDAECRRIVTAA